MMGEHWELFLFFAGLIAAWSLIIMAVLRFMLTRTFAGMEQRMAEIGRIAEKNQTLEREILEMKAELPISYVRREDFIRHEVAILAKLDRLRDLIERPKEGT